MTVDSLFILNNAGAPIIQKHWCDDLSTRRAALVVVPAFTRYLQSVASLGDAEPVWSSPQDTVCIHIQRGDLIYLGIVSREVAPLEVLELLEGVVQALLEYIGQLSELTLKENFTTVYQLLSEMVDSGSAVTTDTSVLRGLVPVPSLVNRVIENVSGIGMRSDAKPDVNTSSIPWRPQGIRHSSNEFFVDIVEKIDAIVDARGSLVSYDVSGDIACKSRLTGMPDLLLIMNRPEIMDDVSFHPCVRLTKWESEKSIGFVPPDGNFKLGSFHVSMDTTNRSLPIYVHAKCMRQESAHTIEIAAEAGQCGGKSVEKVQVRVPLPAQAYNIRVQSKVGTYKVANSRLPQVEWSVKSLKAGDRGARLVIQYLVRSVASNNGVTNGSTGRSSPAVAASSPAVTTAEQAASAAFVDFEVAGFSASSLKVESLKMFREAYKLFKGVRYVTKAGSFQVRF
ncbi:clathrin adaptor, mu subunit [Martensiomyces pterosporus]|nr:clathrin adaptor, mu subunit [Martensiomyces pterosporus]